MTKTTFLKSLLLTIAFGFSSLSAYAQAHSFKLVKSNSEIVDGGRYLIVGGNFAIGLQNANNRSASAVTIAEEIIETEVSTVTTGTLPYVFKVEGSTNAWKLKDEVNDFYLRPRTGPNNGLQGNATPQNWTINIAENGEASMVCETTTEYPRNILRFNSSNNPPLFACYASGQAPVFLYKLQTTSTCTASTLSFANATVSKTMGDAAFTIAATSLNTTTAITYESNNTAVATVNETTGEVTIVSAGTAKIKATQAAGTHASVDYCAATAEYTLNVATNLPTITVTEVLPAFTANVGANDQKTLTVTSANLTADIALTITGDNAAMFAITNTLPAVGGTATITYSPTAPGAHTATLALNSTGATEVLITLNGTSTLANAVATDATAIGPTGFTANWNAVAGATGYVLNVYTGNYLINESFSSLASGNSTSTSGSGTGWDGNDNFSAVAAAYQAGGAVKLGTGSAVGSITTKAIDLTNATSLKFDVKGWTTVEGDILVTVDALAPITVTYTATMSGAFETKTIELPAATATSTVKIATSAKRAFIDNVVIGSSSFVHENLALGNVTSYNVTGLTVNTDYYYTVTAKYNDTASAKSNEIKVTTSETTNSAPSATMQSLRKVGNQIVFETSAQQSVEIFNITGQRLMSTTSVDGVNAITVNTKGLVLVKIGKETTKVIM